jgi:predicted acyltransferase
MGGHILKSEKTPWTKVLWLAGAGVACLALGWGWGLFFPIIKHIWTSSMVLWAAGWSYLLLALFYMVIDVLKFRKWAFPMVVVGMNAIAVYMAAELLDIGGFAEPVLGGLERHIGAFGAFLAAVTPFVLAWLVLLYMYRKGTFIRV